MSTEIGKPFQSLTRTAEPGLAGHPEGAETSVAHMKTQHRSKIKELKHALAVGNHPLKTAGMVGCICTPGASPASILFHWG